jgi:hypothetical protein
MQPMEITALLLSMLILFCSLVSPSINTGSSSYSSSSSSTRRFLFDQNDTHDDSISVELANHSFIFIIGASHSGTSLLKLLFETRFSATVSTMNNHGFKEDEGSNVIMNCIINNNNVCEIYLTYIY